MGPYSIEKPEVNIFPVHPGPCQSGSLHLRGRPPYFLLDERPEPLPAAGVAQFPERLGLDLADALPGHLEVLPHLLERVVRLLADAEPHPQDPFLPTRHGPP